MRRLGRFSGVVKVVQAMALVVAICFTMGATDASSRFNDLGRRMMCTCGCAQLLGECNHVGCPDSGRMRDELTASLQGHLTDQQILDNFATKYGPTVLAAPTTKGFDLVAWIAPVAVFLAAVLGTFLVAKHWSAGRAQLAAEGGAAATPEMVALREKVRRETDTDGGI